MFNEERWERMRSRLLAQFQNKTFIEGILYAMFYETDELEKAYSDLETLRSINTAFGQQLDGIGINVGRSRNIDNVITVPFFGFEEQDGTLGFGQARFKSYDESYLSSTKLLDEEYRKILKLKVLKNSTQATYEDTINAYKVLLNCDRVMLRDIGNAKFVVSVNRMLSDYDIRFMKNINLNIRGGGIGIGYLNTYDGAAFFGFKNQKNAKGMGVGSFSRVII